MTVTHFEVPTANGAFRLARIAFVQSGWHSEIVDNAYQGFLKEIGGLGFSESAIDRFEVPGAFEIPLVAQKVAAETASRCASRALDACSRGWHAAGSHASPSPIT